MIKTEFKQSTNLALPLVAADIAYAINTFISVAMISRLGKEQLAASGLVWQLYMTMVLFFMGPFNIVAVMTSQSLGVKDYSGVAITYKQGLITAIISSVFMAFMLWTAPTILVWTKQSPLVISCAVPFFHALIWSVLPHNLSRVIQQFLTGLGETRVVMLIAMLSVLIEIPLYYVFLFGKFGLPQLGLAGAGYALFIAHSLIVPACVIYLNYSPTTKAYRLFHKWWIINPKFLLEILRVGMPIGFMWCSKSSFFALINIIMGSLSTATLAAYQIARQYLKIPLAIIYSVAQSAAVKVSRKVGQGYYKQLQPTFAMHMVLGFALISIFCLFFLIAPEVAISLDIDMHSDYYREVAKIALQFFPLIVIYLIVDSIRVISSGALRGLKDSKFQLITSILSSWATALPIAYVFGFVYGWGGVGIWWGIIVSFFAVGIILTVRFYKLTRRIDLAVLVTKE